MAKARSVYFCSACGFESPRWLGRCPQCEAWNSFDERPFAVAPARGASRKLFRNANAPMPLHEIDVTRVARMRIGVAEFDAVLGGGIVPGSLTLTRRPAGCREIDARAANRRAGSAARGGRLRLRRGIGRASEAARGTAARRRSRFRACRNESARCPRSTRTHRAALLDRRFNSNGLASRIRSLRRQRHADARLHAGAHGVCEANRLRDVHRRPRHQGRRDRGTAAARASRRHRPLLRR